MQFDQPGHHGFATRVDHACAGRNNHLAGRAHSDNAITLDQYRGMMDRTGAITIEEHAPDECQSIGWGRICYIDCKQRGDQCTQEARHPLYHSKTPECAEIEGFTIAARRKEINSKARRHAAPTDSNGKLTELRVGPQARKGGFAGQFD
jgi:hypothetical protein